MRILGISALYHDSAAAIVDNGALKAASHEERYTRIKQDSSFPINAIGQVLNNCNLSLSEIDKIAWYEDPDLKLKRSKQIIIDTWPKNFGAFNQLMTTKYTSQNYVVNLLRSELNWTREVIFSKHHESHMASAVFGKQGVGKCLALTVDGIGEFETATAYIYDYSDSVSQPKKVWTMSYPNSIGLFYSAVTQLIGFEVNEGEYKVMGLAPYGKPRFIDNLKRGVLTSGSTRLDPQFSKGIINWGHPTIAYGKKLRNLLLTHNKELEFQEKADIAASAQAFLEFILIGILEELIEEHRPVCLRMAGGVALNCTANSAIARHFNLPLDIQPAAGDAGNAVGAALSVAHKMGEWRNEFAPKEFQTLIGSPVAKAIELENFFRNLDPKFRASPTSAVEVAEFLRDGKVVAIARGRAEFGPRALGNRAILASPLSPDMKHHLNAAIKFREQFRPFAPVVCEDDYDSYFERLPGGASRNMLLTVKSKFPELIPAVTHIDNSSRTQELEKDNNPFLWAVLKEFGRLTGVPVLTLTSFNLKGEPMVQNEIDSLSTFVRSGIDILIIEDWKVIKLRSHKIINEISGENLPG